jgi:hypothetical protein
VLAERIALLLWRQQSIARWEANPLQKGQQCVELDLMNEDLIRRTHEGRVTEAITLITIQEDVDWRRRTVEVLGRLRELGNEHPLTADDIAPIMLALERTAKIDLKKKLVPPGVLADVVTEDSYEERDGYTVGLVRSSATLLAKKTRRGSGDALIESAYQSQFIDLRRAENEVRELEIRIAWQRQARDKLPSNAEQLAQHEAHLSRELNTALAQLTALQDRRRQHIGGMVSAIPLLALPDNQLVLETELESCLVAEIPMPRRI